MTANQILALKPLSRFRTENDVTSVAGTRRLSAPSTVTVVEKSEFP